MLRGEEGPGPSLLRSGSVRLSPGERRPEAIASRRSQLPRCSLLWKWRKAGWVQAALQAKYRLARLAAPVLLTCRSVALFRKSRKAIKLCGSPQKALGAEDWK